MPNPPHKLEQMKKLMYLLTCALGWSGCSSTQTPPPFPADRDMEARIEKILDTLTLEEKFGQMCQLTVGMVTDNSDPQHPFISDALLDTVIRHYKVGSILNIPFGIGQPPRVWLEVINKIQQRSLDELGIPCIYGVDQIHGASYTVGATLFPQGINMGAALNVELMRRASEISAYETRACGIPWNFAPVMDLGRDPRWPRMWESYGEDVCINSRMAAASVRGLQGDDPNHIAPTRVAACIKHFMAYGVPVSGKDRTPSSVTRNALREKYFAPFLESIRAGALSLMVNSASNDGMPFHANRELLTGWLKEELGWDGLIVTDWNDIYNLSDRDHIAANHKEAVALAINAGIDMAMVPSDWKFCDYLRELVGEKVVPMSRIDDAVRRVLRLKMRLGLFEKPFPDAEAFDRFACGEFADVALQAAEESQVLLKNEGNLLPLKPSTRILLTGPNANSMRCLNGGWSYSWQGDRCDEFAEEYHTIYEALQEKFDHVTWIPGVEYGTPEEDWQTERLTGIERAVAAARQADVIVACVGENSYCETPGNMNDLNLSPNQQLLVRKLAATGKPVILILNEGRPRLIREIEPLARAVVDVLLPGNYGGDALARLLVGEANFSARLPFTYPRWPDALATYDFKPCQQMGPMEGEYNYDAVMDVQWPFGYGLSYTTFAYANLRAERTEFRDGDLLTFSVDVSNTGDRTGKEAVMLWSSDCVASLTPDVIRLRNFEKIELQPGQTRTVTLSIPASDLAFVGYDGRWRLEAGEFRIRMGTESLTIRCTETRVYETPNIPQAKH